MTIHIEGQRFGRLLAIRPLRSEKKKIIWLFKCDCGNDVEVPATFVVRLHTQSCGCLRVEASRESVLRDISGIRFGRLLVVGRSGTSESGRVGWLCRCDCGAEVVRASKNLVNGTAVSCGCRKIEALGEIHKASVVDLTGQRFGKLVVVKEAAPSRLGDKRWECACDCGGSRTSRHGDLNGGKVVSCGCAYADPVIYMSKEARAKGAIYCGNRRARSMSAEGTHTADEIRALFKKQRGKCAGCHASIKDGYHRDHIIALANEGSNDILNIQLLCAPCNLAKNAKDPIDWAQENGRLL